VLIIAQSVASFWRRSSRVMTCWSLLAALTTVLATSSPVLAQDDEEDEAATLEESDIGAIGRISHLAFPSFGRNTSISPIEFFPYLIQDEHFFFGDARGFVSNYGTFGGNAGLGYRYLNESMLSWYGASLWYDADNTTSKFYQQIGLSLEAIVEGWEFRTNMYLPLSDLKQSYGVDNLNGRFVGNQLLFDSSRRIGTAMKGIDFEGGYGLPVGIMGWESQLRGFVGGYFFNGSKVDNIAGFKARAELAVNNSVSTQVLYTNDKTFGSNTMWGVTLEFPWGDTHPSNRWRRAMPSPYRVVERNYNVIVSQTRSNVQNVVAINPLTGLPYVVEHVPDAGTAGGNGSPGSSFATVAQAQAAGGDLIYVHSGTTLSEAITIANGQSLIGEAANQRIAAQGYGNVLLPSTGGGATPRITGVNGNAVTLGNNSTFRGFTIDTITGNGVVGTGVSNATISDIGFSGISGDAVAITNPSGTLSMSNLAFGTTPGRGLVINGGDATVNFNGTFDHVGGDAITVENTTGGSFNIQNLIIDHAGGRGIFASGLAGAFNSNNLAVLSSGGDAVTFSGGAGAVNLNGITNIVTPAGRGFTMENTDSDATIKDLRVQSTNAAPAVDIDHTTGDVVMSSLALDVNGGAGLVSDTAQNLTINDGAITAVGAPAVDIANSATTITLGGVNADGGAFGIRIVDSTGSFAVKGVTTALGGGGTIQNMTTGAVLLDNAGTVALQRMNLTDNFQAITSSDSDYVLVDYAQITGSTHYALDSMNDQLVSITNSLISTNGAIGEGSIRLRADTFGSYQTQILNSTIADTNGTAISYSNSAAANGSSMGLLMQNNDITATRGGSTAVSVNWNGPVGLTMDHNKFTLVQSNIVGVDVNETSTTDKLTAVVTNNITNVQDTGGIGYRMTAAGTSSIQFGFNGVAFQGGNGIGFEMALGGVSTVVMSTNQVVDNAFGATGILFDSIAAGSSAQFDGNVLQFLSTGLIVDRGIVFTTAGDTVQLSGTQNNIIQGATTNFSAPAGSMTGSIKVNGSPAP
jgi:hypothetical protein